MSKTKDQTKPEIDTKAAVMALEYLFAAGYVNKKKLYLENFLRGLFFSVGTIVGIAIAVTLLLWILSFFDGLPFVNEIRNAIENSSR